jgi:hypothetical protein
MSFGAAVVRRLRLPSRVEVYVVECDGKRKEE